MLEASSDAHKLCSSMLSIELPLTIATRVYVDDSPEMSIQSGRMLSSPDNELRRMAKCKRAPSLLCVSVRRGDGNILEEICCRLVLGWSDGPERQSGGRVA